MMTEPTPEPTIMRTMPVTVHAQYIKDMSFENPGAPEAFKPNAGQPGMNLNINLGVQDMPADQLPNLYEVTLRMQARATRDTKVCFIAEIEYAALVTLSEEVPEDTKHPLLLIEIPRLLFPFARQALSQMSHQGGYPALMIAPVDFQALYIQKFSGDANATAEPQQAASAN
jgi:preprotein translocase subunit SecB